MAAPAYGQPLRACDYRKQPYAFARTVLIRQGVLPIRRKHPRDDWDCEVSKLCGRYPELISCAGDADLCAFLYRRRSDGQFFRVITRGQEADALVVDTIFETDARDLRSDWSPEDDQPRPPPAPPNDWASRSDQPPPVAGVAAKPAKRLPIACRPGPRIPANAPRNAYGGVARVTAEQIRAAVAGLRPSRPRAP